MGMELKLRMVKLRMSQADVIRILRTRGVELDKSYVSRALDGDPAQRFENVRQSINEILTEKEAQRTIGA